MLDAAFYLLTTIRTLDSFTCHVEHLQPVTVQITLNECSPWKAQRAHTYGLLRNSAICQRVQDIPLGLRWVGLFLRPGRLQLPYTETQSSARLDAGGRQASCPSPPQAPLPSKMDAGFVFRFSLLLKPRWKQHGCHCNYRLLPQHTPPPLFEVLF